MPPETILRTKLFAPPPRRNLVSRPRLVQKLAGALLPENRLALVCAPAGFGKTTVVCEWTGCLVAAQGKPEIKIAWLTLDEADNDPIRFLRYIDAALQGIDTRLWESARPALFAPQPPPFRSLLAELANDILSLGNEFILVLDDYHHIEHETVHACVNFMADHLPSLAHLLIVTRSDPPLQLARRRARGEMCELRASDLRFTHLETVQFINEIMRLGLPDQDIADLEIRTEGWIAGLQMAAISLQDVADPHAFVTAFRGDDRYIADYLLEEVLQRQPVEFQQFLLQTSILDRLSGPLCNAVTGRSDSQNVLNTLERSNLFVIPLDNHREWFRYHPLFASLLQQHLQDTHGSPAVIELKRCASKWYDDHGYIVNACEIALSCGDYEQAVAVMEAGNVLLFMGPELNTLRQWTELLPEAVIASHRRLNLMATWASHATGFPRQAEHFVELCEQSVGISVNEYLEGSTEAQLLSPFDRASLLESAIIRARIAVDMLDLEETFALAERALPLVNSSWDGPYAFNAPYQLRCVLLFILGLAHKFQGNMDAAASCFAEAEADATLQHNPHIIALTIGHLGEVQMIQGQLQLAHETFQRGAAAAGIYSPRSSSFWGLAQAGLGELAYEQGSLDQAEVHFQAGIELGKIWNTWECLLPAMLGLARIRAAHNEWDAAYSLLDDLLERTAATARMVRPAVEGLRAAINLRQGNLPAAARWASSFDTAHPSAYRIQWEQNAVVAAQVWLALGRKAEAEALLTRLQEDAQSAGRLLTVQHIRELTRKLETSPASTSNNHVLIEPLSERELEVLRLIAEGWSNPEIARRLYISPNTLKAHAHKIYMKLDAHSRQSAVNKARDLGLI